jgi:hypothetical protein
VRIPKEHSSALRNLTTFPDESYGAIIKALQDSRRVFQPGLLAEDLAKQVADVSESDLKDLVAMLVSMYSALAYFDASVEEFAQSVSEAATQNKLGGVELPADSAKVLEKRLSTLLKTDAIAFRSNAISVLRDQSRLFCNARILTDIRPVFDSDVKLTPKSAFLVHTLRISYHRGSEIEEFYVALDRDDLNTMQEVLERAKIKDDNLRAVLVNIDISAIGE